MHRHSGNDVIENRIRMAGMVKSAIFLVCLKNSRYNGINTSGDMEIVTAAKGRSAKNPETATIA